MTVKCLSAVFQPLQEHRTVCPRYLSGGIPLLLSTQHRPMSSVILSHNKGENDQVVRIMTWRSGEIWRISFRDTSCVGVHVKAVCVDLEMNLVSLLSWPTGETEVFGTELLQRRTRGQRYSKDERGADPDGIPLRDPVQ